MAAITNTTTNIFLTDRTITFSRGLELVTVKNLIPLFLKNLAGLNKDVALKTAESLCNFQATLNPGFKGNDSDKILWVNDIISNLAKYLGGRSDGIQWDWLGTCMLLQFVGLSDEDSNRFAQQLARQRYTPNGLLTINPKPSNSPAFEKKE